MQLLNVLDYLLVIHVWLNVKNQVLKKLVKLHSSQNVNYLESLRTCSLTNQLQCFKTLSRNEKVSFLSISLTQPNPLQKMVSLSNET